VAWYRCKSPAIVEDPLEELTVFEDVDSLVTFEKFEMPEKVPVVAVNAPLERAPVTVSDESVPTLVIWDCAAFTDKVLPVFVNPVPAVTNVSPSTYALLVASVVADGVGTVTAPLNDPVVAVKVPPIKFPENDGPVTAPLNVAVPLGTNIFKASTIVDPEPTESAP